jgi:hypothetical protein
MPPKKTCDNHQILDIITNRCITVGGVTFLKRLKEQTENNIKHFYDEDLVKHKYVVQTTNIPNKTKVTILTFVDTTPITEPILPDIVVSRLKTNIEKAKLNNFYTNKEHKDYCEKKQVVLSTPVVTEYIEYRFTYIKTPLDTLFDYNEPKAFSNVFDKTKYVVNTLHSTYATLRNYNTNYNTKLTNTTNHDVLDIEWFNRLNTYIANLPYEQLFAVYSYTFHGDHLMNNFMRIGKDNNRLTRYIRDFEHNLNDYLKNTYFPLFFPLLNIIKKNINNLSDIMINVDSEILEYKTLIMSDFKTSKNKKELYEFICIKFTLFTKETIVKCIQELIKTVNTAIDGAPPLTKKLVVFRGSKGDYYFNKDTPNMLFRNKGFISTSINRGSASAFMYGDSCCLSFITLLPGTRMLWLEGITRVPGEYEFLLSPKTTFFIRNHRVKKRFLGDEVKDICNKFVGSLYNTSDIVAL